TAATSNPNFPTFCIAPPSHSDAARTRSPTIPSGCRTSKLERFRFIFQGSLGPSPAGESSSLRRCQPAGFAKPHPRGLGSASPQARSPRGPHAAAWPLSNRHVGNLSYEAAPTPVVLSWKLLDKPVNPLNIAWTDPSQT